VVWNDVRLVSLAVLYGAAMRLDNPGKYQGIDIGGSCSQQNSRAGIERCAGRQDVIDKHHPLAVDLMAPVGPDTKCTLHVDGAFGWVSPTCWRVARARRSA
jgi:hypothetical protein